MSNQHKNNSLVPVKKWASEIEFESPPVPSGSNSGTISSIRNAWRACAGINDRGMVLVSEERLHTILRTTPDGARYFLDAISAESKINEDGKIFVQGSEIIKKLDQTIQSPGSIKRRKYARYSEANYRNIRDSKEAQLSLAEFSERLEDLKSTLKRRRIQDRDLRTDELTGAPLNPQRSGFSHIRSVKEYPQFADRIWIGLVVNPETHDVITDNHVNDENELYDLCLKMGWKTEWYDEFMENLNAGHRK